MKIYLAGKVTGARWRREILSPGFSGVADWDWYGSWPVLPKAVLGAHSLTGPHFVGSAGHGGQEHDAPVLSDKHNGAEVARPEIKRLCLDAIDRSDLLFAWLEDGEAFATLAEIGYAHGRGIPVVIGHPQHFPEEGELWFMREMATIVEWAPEGMEGPSAAEACLRAALENPAAWARARHELLTPALSACDSPIERQLLEAFLASGFELAPKLGSIARRYFDVLLYQQHPVGPYHLDFAIVQHNLKVAIECDGHAYHERTKEQARHDKQRDRALVAAGWTVLRYTGSEIYADAMGCVADVLTTMKSAVAHRVHLH